MKKDKTIKRDFYLLVVKVFFSTLISSFIAYLCLFLFLFTFTNNNTVKQTDHFVKYLELIELKIIENASSVLNGQLINVNSYSKEIKGEVLDLSGNHLFGDEIIVGDKIEIIKMINQEIVKESYVYRFIPIQHDNVIQAVYVLKAPFGFIINNKKQLGVVFIYITLLISPLIFFIIYLIVFTTKLYKSLFGNIKILLHASDKITNGDFDFKVEGLKRQEFIKIQESFNTMIRAIKEMIESLSEIDQNRKIMVASIAHDIRTPITVIQGQMDLIEDLKETKNFDIGPHFSIIRKNCRKMNILTDNLSLLYKVEKADFLLNIKKNDLRKILEEKEQEISTMIYNKKSVKISFNLNLSKTFYFFDEAMLMRVLDNILYNSLRFTKIGEIKLEVYDEDDGKVFFKCIDTGSGFNQKDTSVLFELFYQNERYKNHVGLGLYIAKKIVENNNGEIHAYNNEKGGATVEFYINTKQHVI